MTLSFKLSASTRSSTVHPNYAHTPDTAATTTHRQSSPTKQPNGSNVGSAPNAAQEEPQSNGSPTPTLCRPTTRSNKSKRLTRPNHDHPSRPGCNASTNTLLTQHSFSGPTKANKHGTGSTNTAFSTNQHSERTTSATTRDHTSNQDQLAFHQTGRPSCSRSPRPPTPHPQRCTCDHSSMIPITLVGLPQQSISPPLRNSRSSHHHPVTTRSSLSAPTSPTRSPRQRCGIEHARCYPATNYDQTPSTNSVHCRPHTNYEFVFRTHSLTNNAQPRFVRCSTIFDQASFSYPKRRPISTIGIVQTVPTHVKHRRCPDKKIRAPTICPVQEVVRSRSKRYARSWRNGGFAPSSFAAIRPLHQDAHALQPRRFRSGYRSVSATGDSVASLNVSKAWRCAAANINARASSRRA